MENLLKPGLFLVHSLENFCKWVKEYLDSRGPDHRLIFLADEVGQFIGADSHLMLSLQTIIEELGTLCTEEIDPGFNPSGAGADRLALRRQVEESLQRLEKETLISRNGDVYFFLTNEERDINREIKSVRIESGEDARLLGELIFNDVLKEQRKYRYPASKMDFTFNRLCDQHPIGSRVDGALLVSVVTPLNDDYESFSNGKCILESSTEGGYVLIKLGNEESLGRELRIYLQTEKYVKHKNDRTLPESTKRILRGISEDNQDRRKRLVALLGEMLAGACPGAPKSGGEYYVAGQSIKLKATTPISALGESLEYLVRNTFTKMSYLKRTSPEPLKEVQAILHSNDIAQQTLALGTEEGNQQAIDDLRGYIELCTHASRQIVLHNVIEKRYSLRPYGWPDEEVLILVARLLVMGDIRLMMDGALVPPDKAYEAIATPGKRRKVLLVKRRTSDPKALQNARSLGKELFHEMGPDGLIGAVGMVNTALVAERRQQAIERIEGYIAALMGEIEAAHGEAGFRSACLKPLESLLSLVHTENSLAHIAQAEAEALKAFDAAVLRIEGCVKEAAERSTEGGPGAEQGQQPNPVIKKQRVIEPARLVKTTYLETMDEVRAFLDALGEELETAIAHNERIQIR